MTRLTQIPENIGVSLYMDRIGYRRECLPEQAASAGNGIYNNRRKALI